MSGKIIKCSKCNANLFRLPPDYEMSFEVVCCYCETGRKRKARKSKARGKAVSNYAKVKKGIREDIDNVSFFRSKTEANVARLLNYLGIKWKFEERVFTFAGYRRRPYQYIMDFEIISVSPKAKKFGFAPGWLEVKGYMNSQSKAKLSRLKKNYPEDFNKTIVVVYRKSDKNAIEFCEKIGAKYMLYDKLTKEFSDKIEGWES